MDVKKIRAYLTICEKIKDICNYVKSYIWNKTVIYPKKKKEKERREKNSQKALINHLRIWKMYNWV